MSQTKTCTHIKVSGVRCQGPALRGEQFCYFHQHSYRGVRRPPNSRLHPIAMIEDADSIQASLMEVINGLVRNTLDLKRATLILRALHIAVKNAHRLRLDSQVQKREVEIPDYADAPNLPLETKPAFYSSPLSNEEIRAVYREAQQAAGRHVGADSSPRQAREATANVGAEAFLRPAAAKQGVPKADATTAARIAPSPETARLTPSRGRTNASVPTQARKPPVSANATAKTATHPKEREHRASAG